MLKPETYEELAAYLEQDGRFVFLFTADWCPRLPVSLSVFG